MRQPQVVLTVKNGTEHAISKIVFNAIYISEGRQTPWTDETVSYKILGGIEPGETYTWKHDIDILFNDELTVDEWESIIEERVKQEQSYGNLSHTRSEGRIVDNNGILQIPWPRLKEYDEPIHFDLILATATNPTLEGNPPIYPRIKKIARAWKNDSENNVEYFWKNRKFGIRAFQDVKLEKQLTA